MHRLELAGALACLALMSGCPGQGPSASRPSGWVVVAPEALSATERERRDRGLAARDAMAQRLLAALEAALADGGPGRAIDACATLAPDLARQVAEDRAVRLGRTSHRLRNPRNAAPPWAAPLLVSRPAEEVIARGPDGRLGLVLPIRLGPMCVQCHGPVESLAADVRSALAARYPDDAATGFAPGDLRGWFWVEVP